MTSVNRARVSTILAAIFVGFSGLASVAHAEILVKHSKGEVVLKDKPAKVYVFDMASLDTLTALGVDIAGVAGGKKPAYLSKYEGDDVEKIGTLFEPDYEAVNAGEPDLIIVGGRSSAKYEDLARIAPTIDLTVDANRFHESAKTNVRTLAAIFDKKDEAEALITKFDETNSALKEKAANAGKGVLVLTTGGKMSTYGVGSRFGMLFSEYGVQVADNNIKVGNHGQPISFEYILEKNPDWLFVIDRDAAIGRDGGPAKQFLDNEIVGQTTAWKNGQVVYLDAASWYLVGGGITAMQKTVDQLTNAFDKK